MQAALEHTFLGEPLIGYENSIMAASPTVYLDERLVEEVIEQCK